MPFRLEKRLEPSRTMQWLAPIGSVLLTMVVGAIIFSLIGYDGIGAVREIFLGPLLNSLKWQDLLVKASPLIIIGVGLSIAYKANVWNIGAEGQYVAGALAGTAVALATRDMSGPWILPTMLVAGAVGGALWAAVPALLRTQLRVNEILTSLMLTYVAINLLYFLVRVPWKDPMSMGFPQTARLTSSQLLPRVFPPADFPNGLFGVPTTILHWGVPIAFVVALIAWFVMSRSVFGFQVRVVGSAPHAARHAGFSEKRTIWLALLLSGAFAGFAGILELAGPFQRLVTQFPTNYGFTAIIVAFLGRLNPLGVIFAGLMLAITFVGGDLAQTSIQLPNAAVGVFQAMMLFFLLASDILVRYRFRSTGSLAGSTPVSPPAVPAQTGSGA